LWHLVSHPQVGTIGNFGGNILENGLSQNWGSFTLGSGNYNGSIDGPTMGAAKLSVLRTLGWFTVRHHRRCSQTFNLPASYTDTGQCQDGSTNQSVILRNGGGAGASPGKFLTLVHSQGYVTGPNILTVTGSGGATPTITCRLPSTLPFTPDSTTTYYISSSPCYGDGISGVQVVGIGTPSVWTNLVNGQDTDAFGNGTGAKMFLRTAGQKLVSMALCRNMNQGPTHTQSLWYGRVKIYESDPGWGW